MTVLLYAQPYDLAATGFYFEDAETFRAKAANLKNDYGEIVEEFEIQLIDAQRLDCAFAKAWEINQANYAAFLEAADEWDDERKIAYIIAVGECGYGHFDFVDDPDGMDITLYELSSMKELAEQFVEDGLFGDIPERLQVYLDYDAIARDLAMDYTETEIAGTPLIYRCA